MKERIDVDQMMIAVPCKDLGYHRKFLGLFRVGHSHRLSVEKTDRVFREQIGPGIFENVDTVPLDKNRCRIEFTKTGEIYIVDQETWTIEERKIVRTKTIGHGKDFSFWKGPFLYTVCNRLGWYDPKAGKGKGVRVHPSTMS